MGAKMEARIHSKTKEIYYIDIEEADFNFYYQTLIGDAVDNYKGCPNVGKVKATKFLTEEFGVQVV